MLTGGDIFPKNNSTTVHALYLTGHSVAIRLILSEKLCVQPSLYSVSDDSKHLVLRSGISSEKSGVGVSPNFHIFNPPYGLQVTSK